MPAADSRHLDEHNPLDADLPQIAGKDPADQMAADEPVRRAASVVTVGELLEGYAGSAQLWKSATITSHRHVVSALLGDPLCHCRLQSLTPAVVRAAICRWRHGGVSVPRVSARWLLICSAVSWAVVEGLLLLNPLAGMRGPPRPSRSWMSAGGGDAARRDRCGPGADDAARQPVRPAAG